MKILRAEALTEDIKKRFTVPNPVYYKMLKLKKEVAWTPKNVKLNSGSYFPFGALYLDKEKNQIPLAQENTTIILKPKQIPVFVKAKQEKGALIHAKTGAGKTVLTCAFHEVHGGKSIVLAHSLDNVKYFQETFKKFIGVEAGMYCTGSKEIKDVTITTHTTFRKNYKMFAEYGFDNLYVDEADIYFTEKARKSICEFPAKRKYAFTGTLKTDFDEYMDEKKSALELFFGKIVEAENDADKDPLKAIYYREYVKVYQEPIGNRGLMNDIRAKDWITFKWYLDNDMERKKEQLNYIQEMTTEGKTALVLFDRVADVDVFYRSAQARGMKSYMVHGTVPKKEREQIKKDFYKEGGYLFAQHRTMGRGYDNTKLSKVFILFPTRAENQVRQIIGRVLRWYEGKESNVYTWVDSGLRFQHTARCKVFKEHFGITTIKI